MQISANKFLKLPDEARTSNHEVAPVGRASVGNRKNTADGAHHRAK